MAVFNGSFHTSWPVLGPLYCLRTSHATRNGVSSGMHSDATWAVSSDFEISFFSSMALPCSAKHSDERRGMGRSAQHSKSVLSAFHAQGQGLRWLQLVMCPCSTSPTSPPASHSADAAAHSKPHLSCSGEGVKAAIWEWQVTLQGDVDEDVVEASSGQTHTRELEQSRKEQFKLKKLPQQSVLSSTI